MFNINRWIVNRNDRTPAKGKIGIGPKPGLNNQCFLCIYTIFLREQGKIPGYKQVFCTIQGKPEAVRANLAESQVDPENRKKKYDRF